MSVVTHSISPGSPGSPGHRSELRLSLNKNLALTEVTEVTTTVTHLDLTNGNDKVVTANGSVVRPSWENLAKQVYQEELGKEAYRQAIEKQRKSFKASCQEGTIVNGVGIYLKEEKMKTLTGPRSLRMRLRRGQGQGMTGYAVFEPNKVLSHNEFFRPGRMVEVTAVHSNYPLADDDATTCTRTMGIKFAAHPSESPFDLMLHTGNISPAFTANAIEDYVASLASEEARKKYLLSMPIYLETHIESVRAAPSSYYHQHYYCHMTYDVEDASGVPHPCRFRIIPADGSEENGRLTPEQQRQAWNTERSPTDNRPKDYMKAELRHRLQCGALEYLLQVQIHDVPVQTPEHKQVHRCHMTYNQAIAWGDLYHPWETVARIKFTHPLTDDATEIVRYHVAKTPSCIKLPDPEHYTDFNLVPHILRNACDVVEKMMQEHPDPKNIPGDLTDYMVYAATADRTDAGNDAHISISIVGTDSSTAYRRLHQTWKDDITAGRKNTYVITDKIVGEILCIRIYLAVPKGLEVTPWRLDEIVIATPYNGRCYSFPYYGWIQPHQIVVLREGRGLLPVMERNALQRLLRHLELQNRKETICWKELEANDPFHGLPGHLATEDGPKGLPLEMKWEGFDDVVTAWVDHMKTIWQSMGKLRKRISEVLTFRKPVLEPYTKPLTEMLETDTALADTVKNWHLDDEFARQMLNGSHPNLLRRISELPADFPLRAEDLDAYVHEGTFTYELQVGRVYMAEYPSLNALLYENEEKHNRYLCSPRVLLHVMEGQTSLLPLVIQLRSTEGAPVFTPSDDVRADGDSSYSYWDMAKLWVRCADVQLQLLDAYLLKTVLMLEPVTIALFRNVSNIHPISKLLTPFIRYIPAVATLWRKFLLPEHGALAQVLATGERPKDILDILRYQYSDTKLTSLYLPEDLSRREVLDPSMLPNYHYRDDGLKVCCAIRDLCADIVGLHYRDDEEVALDEELQDFLTDLKKNGLPASDDLTAHFSTREEVVRFLCVIIFQSTAQHHAVTSGLVEDMAFTPASPPCLSMPPPAEGAPINSRGFTDEQLRNLLPPVHLSNNFIEMVKLLGRDKPGPKLDELAERHFSEPTVNAAFKRFQTKLKEISESVQERNTSLGRPYTRLIPSQIPASLTA